MIKSIRHKGLKKFFNSGGNDTRGINSDHADKLRDQLAALDSAKDIADMDLPGWRLHPLKGKDKGRHAIWVSGNWRMTFEFENGDALDLTELMGGEIWVESEAGVGSTFFFTAEFGLSEAVDHVDYDSLKTHLSGLTALVVDENKTAREILRATLEGLSMVVEEASSGDAGLELIRQHDAQGNNFDVVFMDWKMPNKDGIQTIREVKSLEVSRQPRSIIMVTAFGRDDASTMAGDTPVDAFMSKPVTHGGVLEAVVNSLNISVEGLAGGKTALDSTAEAKAFLSGANILLVEDNEINQELAIELLRTAGIAVTLAENGQEALDYLSEAPDKAFDGVLMDCQMPVMDGYTATRRIREQARFADLPIIALTANAMAGDREKVIEAGMNDHIAKPINVTDMFTTMARLITPENPTHQEASVGDAAPEVAIPSFTRIDTEYGLGVTEGNTDLCLRLLSRFYTNNQAFKETFQTARDNEDVEAATRSAHSLKGTAGNIGAKVLYEAAEVLEHACENDSADVDDHFRKVLDELDAVLAELKGIDQPASNASVKAFDLEVVNALVLKLGELVAGFDTEAQGVANELSGYLAGHPGEAELKRLTAALNAYDFDTAEAEHAELVGIITNL